MAYRNPALDIALLRAGILPRRGMGTVSADDALASFLSVGQAAASNPGGGQSTFDVGGYTSAVFGTLGAPSSEPSSEGTSWFEDVFSNTQSFVASPTSSSSATSSPSQVTTTSVTAPAARPSPVTAAAAGVGGGFLSFIPALFQGIGAVGSTIPGIADAFGLNKGAEDQREMQQQMLAAQVRAAELDAASRAKAATEWATAVKAAAPYVGGGIALLVLAWGISKAWSARRRRNPPRYSYRRRAR